MDENLSPTKYNGFKDSWKFIWDNSKKPFPHTTFWVYFLIATIGFGGLGVWYELYNASNNYSSLKVAIILFAPPLINSAYFQILLSSKPTKACKAFLGGITAFGNLIFLYLIDHKSTTFTISLIFTTIILVVISLWLSWLHSSLNEDLYDAPPPKASVGGEDLEKPLNGDIPDGFKS